MTIYEKTLATRKPVTEMRAAVLPERMSVIPEEKLTEAQRAQLPAKRAAGEAALSLMDEHLAARAWFVADRASLADVALYAYTHVCEAGGFRLEDYPNVRAWLGRVAALPGYVPMD